MELKDIAVNKIKSASYNPSWRSTHNLKGLTESIKKFGIIEPLVLTTDLNLIDGHRRLAVAKLLKIKTVPCVLRNGASEEIKDMLFLHVNQHSIKISGADQVEIYKKGGKIEQKYLDPLTKLQSIVGNEIIDLLLETRHNPHHVWECFARLKKYCPLKDDKQAIIWLMKTRATGSIRKAIEFGIDYKIILRAIKQNRPIKKVWGI